MRQPTVFVLAHNLRQIDYFARKFARAGLEDDDCPRLMQKPLPFLNSESLRGRDAKSAVIVVLDGWDIHSSRYPHQLNDIDTALSVAEKLKKITVVRCADDNTEPLKEALNKIK
jgi:hypothetical protein